MLLWKDIKNTKYIIFIRMSMKIFLKEVKVPEIAGHIKNPHI